MPAPVESAEAHAGDDDESLTARCARWVAHAAAAATGPCPCSADPDEPGQVRAPPSPRLSARKKYLRQIVDRTPSPAASREKSRPIVFFDAPSAARRRPPLSRPPLLTSHPPPSNLPRSRRDAPTSTTTNPTIAETPITCGGWWRSRCGRLSRRSWRFDFGSTRDFEKPPNAKPPSPISSPPSTYTAKRSHSTPSSSRRRYPADHPRRRSDARTKNRPRANRRATGAKANRTRTRTPPRRRGLPGAGGVWFARSSYRRGAVVILGRRLCVARDGNRVPRRRGRSAWRRWR